MIRIAIFATIRPYSLRLRHSCSQQILPSDSVTLGWTSWALHWLSKTPAPIPDHVLVAFSRDASARAAYTNEPTRIWRNFLLSRASELRAGGRFVVLTMALTDDGAFALPQMAEALYAALMGLVDEGFGTAELQRMAIPICGRSQADLVAPFAEPDSLPGSRWSTSKCFRRGPELAGV